MAPSSSHFASACMLLQVSIAERQWEGPSHALYPTDKQSITADISSLQSEGLARLFRISCGGSKPVNEFSRLASSTTIPSSYNRQATRKKPRRTFRMYMDQEAME